MNFISKRNILIILFLLFAVLKQPLRFDHVDYGIYFAQVKSIVTDGNLNVSDELAQIRMYHSEPIVQTKSGYDPDHHPWGGIPFLVPFYGLGKIFQNLDTSEIELVERGDVISHSLMGLANLFFVILGFFYILKYLVRNNLEDDYIWSFGAVLFATPLYFYTVLAPGNMSTIPFFLMSILLNFLDKNDLLKKGNDLKNFFVLSLFLSLSIIVKIEFVFYSILVPILLVRNRSGVKAYLSSFLGILPAIFFFSINNYIQFDQLSLMYGGVNLSEYLLWDFLFSPLHGYLFVAPILLFLVPLSFYVRVPLITYLAIIPIVKLLIEVFADSSGIDFGARSYIIDLPILVISISHFLKKIRTNIEFKNFIGGVFILFSVWTFFWGNLYPLVAKGETYSYYFKYLDQLFDVFLVALRVDFYFSKLVNAIVLGLLLALILKFKSEVNLRRCSYFLVVSFLVITILNVFNRNQLEDVPGRIVGNGPHMWLYNENVGGINERINKLKNQERFDEIDRLIKYKNSYLINARREVVK